MWDGRIRADARAIPLADQCVQCVVTSPPYWGLRDYGNEGQLGLEKTPEEYVASMLTVFGEVWRVLKDDGVLWLNLGDTYAANRGYQVAQTKDVNTKRAGAEFNDMGAKVPAGFKAKDLIGIPWRVAFALQSAGWYLRSDIIWSKPNPMPESVTDRPTKSHEYIFLLTKSERYYYDHEAIAEKAVGPAGGNVRPNASFRHDPVKHRTKAGLAALQARARENGGFEIRNRRTVWEISTRPYPEAHYATFPEEIPDICIRASSRPGDLILDPFFGSGTVGRVAERLSRRWVGLDLGYQDLQRKRVTSVQRELIGVNP